MISKSFAKAWNGTIPPCCSDPSFPGEASSLVLFPPHGSLAFEEHCREDMLIKVLAFFEPG